MGVALYSTEDFNGSKEWEDSTVFGENQELIHVTLFALVLSGFTTVFFDYKKLYLCIIFISEFVLKY